MKSKRYRQIALSPDNYERIQSIGRMGETFDEVMTRILDSYLEHQ